MRTISKTRYELAAALLSLSVTSCSGDGEPEDVETTTAPLTFSPAQSGTANQFGYTWTSGQADRPMVPSDGNSCFLTGLHGTFTSAGDQVYIRNAIVNGVAMWHLGGTRGTGAPGGRAFCFMGRAPVIAGSWSPGQAEVDLASISNRACFLTGVKGRFSIATQSAVGLTDRDGRWILGGSGLAGSGLEVRSSCVPGTFLNIGVAPITRTSNGTSPLVTWFGGSNWPFGCALSRVSGVLGSGSRIETYVGLSGDNRRWNLSQTQPLFLALSSTAYCIQ